MFILEDPYVSDLLRNTIEEQGYCVLWNKMAAEQNFSDNVPICDDLQLIQAFHEKQTLYSNSENSIGWIIQHLPSTNLPKQIEIFKNKVLFRKILNQLYPGFYFRELRQEELEVFDISGLKKPFVLKPSYGFLSIGVYTINSNPDWLKAIEEIKGRRLKTDKVFPEEVLSTEKYILEEYIPGKEYANDVYYDRNGKPVVINILEHVFSSASDVSDRLYITSKEIILDNLDRITRFLETIGSHVPLRNFPVHLEVRIHEDNMVPVEVNPMRFAGWCTTDIVHYAFGINPYVFFMNQQQPDWLDILKGKADKIYSIIVLGKPDENPKSECIGFDYENLLSRFEKVIEFRKIDFRKYPLFGFLFTETDKNNFQELDRILTDNLREYIVS